MKSLKQKSARVEDLAAEVIGSSFFLIELTKVKYYLVLRRNWVSNSTGTIC